MSFLKMIGNFFLQVFPPTPPLEKPKQPHVLTRFGELKELKKLKDSGALREHRE